MGGPTVLPKDGVLRKTRGPWIGPGKPTGRPQVPPSVLSKEHQGAQRLRTVLEKMEKATTMKK